MLKVLIVEDEFLVADMAEEMLNAHGYDVCGIAGTISVPPAACSALTNDLALARCSASAGTGLGNSTSMV